MTTHGDALDHVDAAHIALVRLSALTNTYALSNMWPNPNDGPALSVDEHDSIRMMMGELLTQAREAVNRLYDATKGIIPTTDGIEE